MTRKSTEQIFDERLMPDLTPIQLEDLKQLRAELAIQLQRKRNLLISLKGCNKKIERLQDNIQTLVELPAKAEDI